MQKNNKYRDEEAIGYLTALVSQAMSSSLFNEFAARGIDLPYAQFLLLAQLFLQDGQTQQELADHMGKDKASVKRTADNLIIKGLVVKEREEGAIKNVPLFVTPKARQIEEQIMQISKDNFSSITTDIPHADLEITRNTLHQLLDNIKKITSR